MSISTTILQKYISYPNDPESNWNVALHYDLIGQTASAVSFYIRTAERTTDKLLQYECLIRASSCFDRQGARNFTVKGLLQHAISIQPNRPEAYYLLSKFYERQTNDGHWNYSYMMASIGESILKQKHIPLRTRVDYPGEYALLFQKAVSAWWCGLTEESLELFTHLYLNAPLDLTHYLAVYSNLKRLNSAYGTYIPFEIYTNKHHNQLKYKFPGSEHITRNYSEAFQDMFILSVLEGKRNGTYLEIGSGHYSYGNNTRLLEEEFEWSGIGVDLNSKLVEEYNSKRTNPAIIADALEIDYVQLLLEDHFHLQSDKVIDYLQLDCDPPAITYQILKKIPFDEVKFRVITYEHDYYADETKAYQQLSTDYLLSKGYVKLIDGVSPDGVRVYEDWWIHPELVNISKLQFNAKTSKARDLFLN